jgi:hypothetical protein
MRSLVLAYSLTLALPQGWCCLFAVQPQKHPAARHEQGMARCCCPSTAPQPGDPNRDPSPSDAPSAPVRHCPCTDRNTTLPKSAVEKIDTDLGLVAVLPVVAPHVEPSGVVELAACPSGPPPRPLHVLHCQWLC